MSQNARVALSRLVAALEHHYEMACNADVVKPAMLEDAEVRLQDAFFNYDDALFTGYGIELPLELLDDDDDDDDDDGDDDDFDDEDDDFDEDSDDLDEEDSVVGLFDED